MNDTAEAPLRPGGTALLQGRPVARIGFGAMQLSGPGGRRAPDAETAHAVLRRALELGVNHIDTAHFYGAGVANDRIRAALAPYSDDLVLVSKVGARHDLGQPLVAAQRPEELRAEVEANLRSLDVEQIAVVNMRRMDSRPGVVAQGEQVVDLDSQLTELVALRDEGKIGGIGVSNVSLEQLRAALPVGLVCVQNAYSVLDRSSEPLLALCREHDLAWVPYFPLGSAFPGMPKVAEQPAVVAAAASTRATSAQIGLAWLLAHDPHTLIIPGTASVAHLEDNLATASVQLDAATLTDLDALAAAG